MMFFILKTEQESLEDEDRTNFFTTDFSFFEIHVDHSALRLQTNFWPILKRLNQS